MKETIFFIQFNIRKGKGLESFGRFNLGNNKAAALSIFAQLKGNGNVNESTVLTMDFMETSNGLPLNVQILACTLEEIAENCRLITKETFKQLNLEKE